MKLSNIDQLIGLNIPKKLQLNFLPSTVNKYNRFTGLEYFDLHNKKGAI